MTKGEAIEVMKAYRDKLTNSVSNQLDGDIKALEMAISALSQEPCDDVVSIRKDILKCRVGNIVAYNVEWLKKHWQMEMDIVCGVKPCDDAISRDAVLKTLDNMDKALDENRTVEEYKALLKECYKELPSVTQKSGKWQVVSDGYEDGMSDKNK